MHTSDAERVGFRGPTPRHMTGESGQEAMCPTPSIDGERGHDSCRAINSQCRRLKCRDGSVQAMQLDIFDHSCDVMLRNDVGAALARRDAFAARSAWHLFKDECPTDETVPALAV
jgi:hypothetical protein